MTAKDNYHKVSDKSLVLENRFANNIGRPYLCNECGFEPCICEYIIGIDAETGYWIVDDWGEL
jgi:hypothetical protein